MKRFLFTQSNCHCLLYLLLMVFLFPAILAAQETTGIRGIVKNEKKELLPGVSVIARSNKTNFSAGAQTDTNGIFEFSKLPAGGPYSFTFTIVGYETRTLSGYSLKADATVSLVVKLEELATVMENVVVVGYGTQRKKDVTGAVVNIKAKDLPAVANTSINNLLQGRAAGLNISNRSAQPGGGLTVDIRGAISPRGNNAPLYVIDGVPILNNISPEPSIADDDLGYYGGIDRDPLSAINPADIESIDILKDASATAIYGSAAANGVILITTQRGKAGKIITRYSGSITVQTPKDYFDFLNAKEFMQQQVRLANDKYLYDRNLPPYGATDPSTVPPFVPLFSQETINAAGSGTDWIGMLIRNGTIHEHNISVSGGSDKTRVYTSFSYFDNKGILENSEFRRLTGRVNIDQQISDRIKLSLNLTFSQTNSNNAATGTNDGGQEKYNQMQAAYSFAPTVDVFDSTGNYTKSYNRLITNPAAFFIIRDKTRTNRFFAAPNLEIKILDNLKLNAVGGIDRQSATRNFYLPRKVQNYQLPEGMAQLTNTAIGNYSVESYLTFNKSFGENNLNIVGGVGYYKSLTENFGLQAVGFFTDALDYYNVGVASNKDKTFVSSYREPDRTKISQFFRIGYSHKLKYILTLTGRSDGSSYFAENRKWGFFPGISAAWRISEEPFLSGSSIVTDLKLRAGYGTSGNESILGANALSLYGTSGGSFLIGNTLYQGVALVQIANPDLTWETNRTINFGLDVGLFNNRLTGSIDVFRRDAKDLLDFNPLPSNNAVGRVAANVGSARSQGLEIAINSINSQGALKWNTSFNISTYKIYWTERNPAIALASYIGAKDPLRQVYGWKTDGIIKEVKDIPSYMPNARPGNIRYVDINNDGKLDISDVVKLGNRDPQWSFGLGNTFSYKNFDLMIFLYGRLKQYMTNNYSPFYDPMRIAVPDAMNTLVDIKNVWSSDNPAGFLPGIAPNPYAGSNPSGATDFYQEDVNFLRLRNITLGYTFRRIKWMQSLRVFADLQNVGVWTNYKGYDPEFTEANPYPQALSTTFGINVNF